MPQAVRDRAYRRAGAAVDALRPDQGATEIAVLEFAGELFAALAVELCAHLPDLRKLIRRVEGLAGVSPLVLGREVLRAPQLLELPTAVAVEVELTFLLAFADAEAVSLWVLAEGGDPERLAHAGARDSEESRRLALSLLAGEHAAVSRSESFYGIRLDVPEQARAALVAHGDAGSARARALLAEIAAPTLVAALARDRALRGRASSERDVASVERTLRRLRFDLHDGPQQDVIMLAEDLRFFGDQLATVIENDMVRERMTGRIDDLQARLVALDGDLRRISGSLLSPFLQSEPLPDAIAQIAAAFTARTQIVPRLTMEGELTGLTDSQQIALLALIREALANIREHSGAEHVTIALSAGRQGVDATVTDDGQGFDPETALLKAARDGHLGLVGMHERVRLLGGQTTIDSRAGGPTVISVRLPPAPTAEPSS